VTTNDGRSGRPDAGADGASGPSGGSGGETRPMTAVRTDASGGATKTAPTAPAAPAQRDGKPAPPKKSGAAPAPAATKGATTAQRKGAPARPAGQRPAGPTGRRVRLTVSRVDPWSAMKMSFLLSVAIGIAMVVMVFVLWSVLAGMGIFDRVNDIAAQIFGADGSEPFDVMDYIGLGRVVSLSIVIGVIDVILITAIATLGAFLYNVSAALVGGLQLTLTDD
jgi:hypothetical protein